MLLPNLTIRVLFAVVFLNVKNVWRHRSVIGAKIGAHLTRIGADGHAILRQSYSEEHSAMTTLKKLTHACVHILTLDLIGAISKRIHSIENTKNN